jgi:hypothetical protein
VPQNLDQVDTLEIEGIVVALDEGCGRLGRVDQLVR